MPRMKNRTALRNRLFEARGGRCECHGRHVFMYGEPLTMGHMHETPHRRNGGTTRPYCLPEDGPAEDHGIVHLLCCEGHESACMKRPAERKFWRKFTTRDYLARKAYLGEKDPCRKA